MTTKNGKNIDNDAVERILSMLLDPKSLMRFKCVSKTWYALITNPMFVAKQLSNALNNKNSISVLVRHLVQKDTNHNSESEIGEQAFALLNFCNDVVNDIVNVDMPLCDGGLKAEGSLSIIGHCNGIICLANPISGEIILCNPTIQESKLIPSPPYPQDYTVFGPTQNFVYALGFGYNVILNEYKIINIGYSQTEHCDDGFVICHPPKAVVHTLGTNCWREIKAGCFETETSVLWPEQFQVYVKQMCYWLGREHHKELIVFDTMEEEFFRNIIIMFDTGVEVFHYIMLPDFGDEHYEFLYYSFHLLVWNESIALFGYKHSEGRFGMWVMDDEFDVIKRVEGAWTKHIVFEPYECPLAFWKSEEILLTVHNSLLSYNLATKKRKYLPIDKLPLQNISYNSRAIVYVNSIVPVLRSNSIKKCLDNSSTNELVFDIFNRSSVFNHHSMMKRKSNSYSIWAIPPDDVSFRIKKVMEELRVEFGGPKIEPHITIVGSLRMTEEDMLNKFSSLRSLSWIIAGQPEVSLVVTRNFYYQCVSLQLSSKLVERCSYQFHINGDPRPHLSLFYGYLTEEERKKAKEIVNNLDKSICSMTFPLNRIALYKIDYTDTSLRSWEKIVEFPLHQEYEFPIYPENAAGNPIWYIKNV